MANVEIANTWYVDATGQLTTNKNTLVAGIVLTSNGAGDVIILKESSSSGTKVKVAAQAANQTVHLDLSDAPMVFANGIYVDTLTASAVATLITTAGGGN